jgi:hypothetical protein
LASSFSFCFCMSFHGVLGCILYRLL